MQATVELPEAILQQLEALARSKGTTAAGLIQQIVQAHLTNRQTLDEFHFAVPLPVIPAAETGPIQPISGKDIDELLLHDPFTS